jgi:hypothetical protein
MKTLSKVIVALSLLALVPTADAYKGYRANRVGADRHAAGRAAKAYGQQRSALSRISYRQTIPAAPVAKKAEKPVSEHIQKATTKSYISRELHAMFKAGCATKDANIRVTDIQFSDNKSAYKGGEKFKGWTATVVVNGEHLGASGYANDKRNSQYKGQRRIIDAKAERRLHAVHTSKK